VAKFLAVVNTVVDGSFRSGFGRGCGCFAHVNLLRINTAYILPFFGRDLPIGGLGPCFSRVTALVAGWDVSGP
jgi:hypothetical protein